MPHLLGKVNGRNKNSNVILLACSNSAIYPINWLTFGNTWRQVARWGDDLLRCYDIVGLSPTNNALRRASRFGRLRRDQRRITGRQFNTATLLDEGAYLVWKCGETGTHVLARLCRVAANHADYQPRYPKLRQERDHCQLAYRLQHQLPRVMRKLEAQWPAD